MLATWTLNRDDQHALHCAALHASIAVLQVLTHTNLRGLCPTWRDVSGHSPTDCFYIGREERCTIVREPFQKEEQAWWHLVHSVCCYNGLVLGDTEPGWRGKYEAHRSMETPERRSEDNLDDDEFVDAVEVQNA